ncbi:hypothetical protein Tco_1040958 [Tanacetum coccineum]|uniref:Uncharacterized protein n=1 Tax=Tanacetum coccineum TaxID=301880 RepID=A0ABQ5GET9_9ASTR
MKDSFVEDIHVAGTLVEEDILVDNLAKEDILVTGSLMEEDILAGILVVDTLWVFMRRVPCWWITLEEDFRLVEYILLVKEGLLSEDILLKTDAGPSVEERGILFLEAQDHVKKGPLFKRA